MQNATKFWSSFRMALRKVGGTNRNNFESAALVCTTIIFGLPSSVSDDDVSIDMTTAHCQSFIDLYSGFLTWKLLWYALDIVWKYFGTKSLAGKIEESSIILDFFEFLTLKKGIKVSQFINCVLFLFLLTAKFEKIVTDFQNQQCTVRKHKSFFVVFFASSSYH